MLESDAPQARQSIARAIGGNALDLPPSQATWLPRETFALPDNQILPCQDGVIFGAIQIDNRRVECVGVAPGTLLTVARAQRITEMLDPDSDLPLCLLCDAEQSLDPAEDAKGLALAYANLARKIASCRLAGRDVSSFGMTGGTGAAFMVLGMMAERVVLGKKANCNAVPEKIAKALLGEGYAKANAGAVELLEIGAVEALIDDAHNDWTSAIIRLSSSSRNSRPVFATQVETAASLIHIFTERDSES